MALDRQTEMTADEIEAFLGTRETGVLSLARRDDPYAIPISYGYDPESQQFYMRLVSEPDSEKRAFLEESVTARFVVYEDGDGVYRSVVATGTLESVSTADLDVDRIEQFGRAKRPLFELWKQSTDDLDIDLYELSPDELTGRRIELGE